MTPLRFCLPLADGRVAYAIRHASGAPIGRHPDAVKMRHDGVWDRYLATVITDGPVESIDWDVETSVDVGDWTLADPDMESVKFPLTITVDQRAALIAADLDDVAGAYVRARETRVESHTIDVSGVSPLPIEHDGVLVEKPSNWRPAEALVHAYGPAWSHIYPGVLLGWRERAIEIANSMCSTVYTHDSNSRLTAHVTVKTETTARISVEIETPPHIVGVNLADALYNWIAAEEAVKVALSEYSGKACGHCAGSGWTVEKGDQS